jgi:hypothetical protein
MFNRRRRAVPVRVVRQFVVPSAAPVKHRVVKFVRASKLSTCASINDPNCMTLRVMPGAQKKSVPAHTDKHAKMVISECSAS